MTLNTFISREWLLNQIFSLNVHKHVLIVGSAGTGKTTICKQLPLAEHSPIYNENSNIEILHTHYCSRFDDNSTDVNNLSTILSTILSDKFLLNNKNLIDSLNELKTSLNDLFINKIFYIVIDSLDDAPNDFAEFVTTIRLNLPNFIKLIITRKHKAGDGSFEVIDLDYKDEPAEYGHNKQLKKDVLYYIFHNIESNAYLQNLYSNIDENYELLIKNIGKLIIKSNYNFLYVKIFFKFIELNQREFETIKDVPSTLNGLYLYVLDFYSNKFNGNVEISDSTLSSDVTPSSSSESSNQTFTLSVCSPSLSSSSISTKSSKSWVFYSANSYSEQQYNQNPDDLFHLILSIFLVVKMKPLSKLQLYERLNAKLSNLNDDLFDNIFDTISPVLFVQIIVTNNVKYTLQHDSMFDFMNDVKFCTTRHLCKYNEANGILACYFYKQLLNLANTSVRNNRRLFMVYLNNFKDHLMDLQKPSDINVNLNSIFNNAKNLILQNVEPPAPQPQAIRRTNRFCRFLKKYFCCCCFSSK